MPAKAPTPRQLFVERMKREGREAEWNETIKALMAKDGKKFGQVAGAAMRHMGYESPAAERKLHEEYLANLHKTSAERATEKAVTEAREEAKVTRFEEAVRLLPDNAPKAVELSWIEAHPAMVRKHRDPKGLTVLITADDILCAPHGKAPSKGAVYALQHWCNQPNELFKQLLGEHKKVKDDETGRRTEGDEDLAEVERILSEVSGELVSGNAETGRGGPDSTVRGGAVHPANVPDVDGDVPGELPVQRPGGEGPVDPGVQGVCDGGWHKGDS